MSRPRLAPQVVDAFAFGGRHREQTWTFRAMVRRWVYEESSFNSIDSMASELSTESYRSESALMDDVFCCTSYDRETKGAPESTPGVLSGGWRITCVVSRQRARSQLS